MKKDNPLNSEFTETEIKLLTPDLDYVRTNLWRIGAKLISKRTHELNLRFDHPCLDLVSKRMVLRLRRDQNSTLTYKDNATLTDGIISRYELETTVENFENTKNIFLKMGFNVSDSYEKFRTTYSFQNVEIVLDELPYGNFVEIEGAHNDIVETIQQLNLSTTSRMNHSYLQLFYICQNWVKKEMNIQIKNFRFKDFSGIRIPPEVITQANIGNQLE